MELSEANEKGFETLTLNGLHAIIDHTQISADEAGMSEVHEYSVVIGKLNDVSGRFHVVQGVYVDTANKEFRLVF